jgi:hypothetical protein
VSDSDINPALLAFDTIDHSFTSQFVVLSIWGWDSPLPPFELDQAVKCPGILVLWPKGSIWGTYKMGYKRSQRLQNTKQIFRRLRTSLINQTGLV